MDKILSHKDLIVWKRAMELVTDIYVLTEKFPQTEIYGLTSQMRRAAVSIPSNIAEGRRGGTKKEFRQFLVIALGSAFEIETQLEIAKQLKFGERSDYESIEQRLLEVIKMLNKMISNLKPNS